MFRFVSYSIVQGFTSIAIISLWLYFFWPVCPATALNTNGIQAQDITFEDTTGTQHSLSEYSGLPVIVNLWATWCGPCVREMPSLEKLQNDYKSKGLMVLTLSEDNSLDNAIAFYKSHSINVFQPFFDRDHQTMKQIHARGIPTSILIDKNGKILNVLEGDIDWQSPATTNAMNVWLK